MGLRIKPAWKVEVDGRDITERLRDRLISLEVSDGKQARQDSASITLWDDPPVDWPAAGRVIKIWMGWDDDLTEMGEYQVAAPESSGPPAIFKVACNPLPPPRPRSGLEGVDYTALGQSTFSYAAEGEQLDKWIQRTAQQLGLRANVHASVRDQVVTQTQQNETHGKFLDRLARERGLTIRVRNGDLIVTDAHSTSTARAGREVTRTAIDFADIVEWSGTIVERSTVRRVAARWHDPARGTGGESATGSGSPARTLPTIYPTEAAATQAARAALRRSRAGGGALSLTVKGAPALAAHGIVDLSEALRPGLDGAYQINEAKHILDSSGYQTSLACEQAL